MEVRSHCPINYGLEHFGDKWSLLIIRDLMFKGKRHYNEFLEGGERVSTSVLGSRLRQLENVGLISKGEDDVKKSRIKYSLTQKGIDMLPFMVADCAHPLFRRTRHIRQDCRDCRFYLRDRRGECNRYRC